MHCPSERGAQLALSPDPQHPHRTQVNDVHMSFIESYFSVSD